MKKIFTIIFTLVFISSAAVSCFANDITGKHKANEITCADCHGTDTPERRAKQSACFECHDEEVEIDDVLADGKVINAHKSPHGKIRCNHCHKSHKPSVLYCNDCHAFEIKVP